MRAISRLAICGLAAGRKWLLVVLGIGLALIAAPIATRALTARANQAPRPRAPSSLSTTERPASVRPHIAGTVHFDLLAKLLADDRRGTSPAEWLAKLADRDATLQVAPHDLPLLGQTAPDFTLSDHRGQPWSLHDQLARGPVVLVFYLGYSCNACVHDLCELNADLERFRHFGAEVVAVSDDAPEVTRQRFEQFGAFDFPVLADRDHAVAQTYGAFRAENQQQPEQLLHGTFIIDSGSIIRWVQCGDTPFRNNMALLYELSQLKASR